MSKSKEAWEQELAQWRGKGVNAYPAVKEYIDSLSKKELSGPATKKIYAERITRCRKANNLTQESAATALDLSHTAIRDQENIDKTSESTPIDRYYLEAFSYLYRVSPNYLIGRQEDPTVYTDAGVEPCLQEGIMSHEGNLVVIDLAELILADLLSDTAEKELNEDLLNVYLQLSDATMELINDIILALLGIPKIEAAMNSFQKHREEISVVDCYTEFYYGTFKIEIEDIPGEKLLDRKERYWREKDNYIRHRFDKLLKLGRKSEKFLTLLCAVARADNQVKRLTLSVIKDGGFLERPRGFRHSSQ